MKNISNRTLLIITIALLISNIVFLSIIYINPTDSTSLESSNKNYHSDKKLHFEQMLFTELELNQEQIVSITEERKTYREEKIKIKSQMQNIRIDINKEITSPNTNLTIIDSLTKEFAQVHIAFDNLNIKSLLAIKKHLNEKQKSKYDSIIRDFATHQKHFRSNNNKTNFKTKN